MFVEPPVVYQLFVEVEVEVDLIAALFVVKVCLLAVAVAQQLVE